MDFGVGGFRTASETPEAMGRVASATPPARRVRPPSRDGVSKPPGALRSPAFSLLMTLRLGIANIWQMW